MRPGDTATLRRWTISVATALFAALVTLAAPANSQGIIKRGDAAVTGFSGVVSFPAPADATDPFDYVSVNTGGDSARVVDLSQLGAQGTLSTVDKPFSVTAGQVGQVFGVTLDNATNPNIYLAATSVYGLSIYVLDANGQLMRVRQGTPGAQFVPGQFGPPELGGGPGSIWRVDGTSGEVALFANIDGGSGSVAALGGLAFDRNSQQIFAAERGTGIVYRFGLDGTLRGTYDHGTEGRPNAGLPPVPMTGAVPVDIQSPTFDPGNPKTWGLAPPARRVFALAVYNGRLYYAIAQGPQIWSAGIASSGQIPGHDARVEVEVPSLADGIEITSLDFDGQGRMYVAERGATTGDYDMNQLAFDGQSRVLRYVPKPPGDPSPGLWRLAPDEYPVGLPPVYNNAAGGVALNYAYGPANSINLGACDATVWTTGDRLLDPGDGSPEGSYPTVEGLQGNATSLIEPQNEPPTASWFIDYDDQSGDASLRGYAGDIATIPCLGATRPPPVVCPPNTYFSNGLCLIYPTCPEGTVRRGNQCVYPDCPQGYYRDQRGQCVPPPQTCDRGYTYYNGRCVPLGCPDGLERTPNGFCACSRNEIYLNGECVPPRRCDPPYIEVGGLCICPLGLIGGDCRPPKRCADNEILTIEGRCEPLNCPPGEEPKNHQCVPITCPNGTDLFNGQCVPRCKKGFTHVMPDGACVRRAFPIYCIFGKEPYNGTCVDKCTPPRVHTPPNGACELPLRPPGAVIGNPGLIAPLVCPAGQEPYNGACVDKCTPPQVHTPPNGACKAPLRPPGAVIGNPGLIAPLVCPAGQEPYKGACVDKCTPPQVHTPPNGACKAPFKAPGAAVGNPGLIAPLVCPAGQEPYNGACVAKCTPPRVHTAPNGACKMPLAAPDLNQDLPKLDIKP